MFFKNKKKSIQKSFFEISKFNDQELCDHLNKNNNVILDFGCGNGCFKKNFFSKKVEQIKMYDKDKNLKRFIQKKYEKNPNIRWVQNINVSFNIVLINSTIQYFTLKKYKTLMSYFFKRKVDLIIISDIPKYPFYLEAFICIFINIKRILISIKYLFQKDYNFYFFKKKRDLILDNKKYKYKFCRNLNDDKILRYTIIYEKVVPKK